MNAELEIRIAEVRERKSLWSAAMFLILICLILPAIQLYAQEPLQPITFALVGDIMLGSDYPDDERLPPDDGIALLSEAKVFLSAADVAIGNLEGPITDASACAKKTSEGRTYVFRMPKNLAPRLAEAGFDVLNTANNHSNDFGIEGRLDTKNILDSLGIAHTGHHGDIANIEVERTRIAIVGFSTNPGNFSLFDLDAAAALVESLDVTNDIVVATFHGGAEGAEYTHLPDGTEYYLGEERGDLRRFARCLVDAGADIVFGHGPHVPRAIEIYNDKLIAYSLGNFCTWYGISVRGINGLAPLLWVELDCDGNLAAMKIVSFEQKTHHYPVLDNRMNAAKLILQLSETDVDGFPHELLQYE